MAFHKLQLQRDGHKRVIQRFIERLEESQDEERLVEFEGTLEKLELKVSSLKTIHDKILSQFEMEDYATEMLEIDEYTLDIDLKLRQYRLFIERCNASVTNVTANACTEPVEILPVPRPAPTPTLLLPETSVCPLPNTPQFSHLPKLSLPTFDGNVLQWQSFWDCFESSIHMNVSLSDVQKFSYLKAQLEGPAAMTVEGFALTNGNYARAVELLKERYGLHCKIVHTTMKAMLALPAPTLNVTNLRQFYDRMEAYIRGLEAMGKEQESYGSFLVPIILDKMPSEIRQCLARQNENNDWILEDLRKAINREIKIIEAGSSTTTDVYSTNQTALFYTDTRPKISHKHRTKSPPKPSTPSPKKSRPNPVKCAFCSEHHHSNECDKHPDMSGRMTVVKQRQLCFNCLGKHQLSKCPSKKTCRFCNKRHHTSICSKNPAFQTNPSKTPGTTIMHTSADHDQPDVLLKTAVAEVQSDHYSTTANILFDEGSQRTFITQKLADELHVQPTGSETIYVASFGSDNHSERHMDTADIYLHTDRGDKIKLHVLIVPTIAVPIQNRTHETSTKLPYLQGLKLAHPVTTDDVFEISLLIGVDHYWQIVQNRIIRGNGPTAVQSKIGYLLSGPIQQTRDKTPTKLVMNVVTSPFCPDDIDRFWKLESLGISADEDSVVTKKDAMLEYQQTMIEYNDGKYEARLPWKHEHDPLPDNYYTARKRTENTIRRLEKDPKILKVYGDIIADQERRGFIERVPEPEVRDTTRAVHYIPHHPVKKDSTTTPVRIVYDCSCRQSPDVPSLNDCLQSTPPALNDITTILVRFRLHPYAISADIEKAFLHVGLHADDRDVTRFLWLSDPSDVSSHLQTYRFKSVLFGATCSPFILSATLQKHLQQNRETWVSEILERDLYVDNIMSSFPREDTVVSFYQESRDIMSKAAFNLRSWTSNSNQLKQQAQLDNVLESSPVVKVLGMKWNTEDDALSYVDNLIPTTANVTKRELLRQTSKIYDPLGLLSPVTVRAKIMIQDLWKQNYDWDQPLPEEIQNKWFSIARDLNLATVTTVPRYYYVSADTNTYDHCTLHVFVDASIKSYGAAAYLVKGPATSLMMAKNRVAPLKSITLPKLELMAAVIGSRLATHLKPTLEVDRIVYWSDSQIVLHWLQDKKQVQRFIKNRVDEINKLTDGSTWRYCPTHCNPADLLTRGITATQYTENELWWKGPTWLTDESRWPVWNLAVTNQPVTVTMTTDVTCLNLPSTSSAVTPTPSAVTSTPSAVTSTSPAVTSTSVPSIENQIDKVIDIERFNKYKKLLRVSAYVVRFINNCRRPKAERKRNRLTVFELRDAETMWLRSCQHHSYPSEIENLLSHRTKHTTIVRQLQLYLDADNLLRCKGRIHNAPVSHTTKFPVLLPANHLLTKLIVLDAHIVTQHSGVNAVITTLRQKFWIPSIRRCVKAVIYKCVTCKKVCGQPYRAPDPPPLVKYRVSDSEPFSVTGVDYTGALSVMTANRTEQSVYICLFTCASTRAVHLEVVPDLSSEAFLQAFRRFTSRKSIPRRMVSDNATTFVSAANQLQRLSRKDDVQDELTNRSVTWEFIPKRAPWFGGFWERLIGLTKQAIKKVLGRAFVTFEMLRTIVTEVEATLNDRPLTYVDSEFDSPEALTPAHLLYGRRIKTLPHQEDVPTEMSPTDARDILTLSERTQTLIAHFRSRWKREYLTALRERHTNTGHNDQTVSVGDIVQVHDEIPRGKWKLARVIDVNRGNDGLIRSAKIRTANGETNRPITKLYPLEVNHYDEL